MILVSITVILSFFLESIISNFISMNSHMWIPLFTIVSLIIIYPYFKGKEQNYFKACAAIGLLYDVVFTDTPLMNLVLFLFVAGCIHLMNKIISTNILNICIMVFVSVLMYRIGSYAILCLAGFLIFEPMKLVISIYSSLLLNMIYGILIYIVTDYFARRYRVYKID